MKRSLILAVLFFCIVEASGQANYFPSSGNVGIGTIGSPGALLHVNGQSSLGDSYDPIFYGLVQVLRPANQPDNKFHLSFIRAGNGIFGMGFMPNSNSFGLWYGNNNSGTPLITLIPEQKVGIGLSTPSTLLHVHNPSLPANTVGSTSDIANFSGVTANLGQFKFLHRRHTLNGSWENVSSRLQYVTDVTNQGYIEFNPSGDPYGIAIGSTSREIMRLKDNGCVGIGTANPKEALQIGDRFTFQDGGWKTINYNASWDFAQSINTRIVAGPNATIGFTDQGNIIFQTAPTGAAGSPLNNAVHAMIVHNSGQVGIGTAYTKTSFQDASFRLYVEGGVRARKVKVDQSSWPDYVFEHDYPLPALSEVQAFISQNKHLPGVPSADDVEKNGIDLGDNQATLLKKIEELTLYILNQEKRLIAQENALQRQQVEIDVLKKK